MALITWCEELSTDIEAIDAEHKILLGHANDLYDAILFGHGKDLLEETMQDLIHYINTHFSHEEELMFATKYPDFQAHVKEHDLLRVQVMRLEEEIQKGATKALANETFVFLKGWITGHVLFCDKAFAPHLKAHGIK